MEYNYNYRIGLIIQRNGYIDILNGQDMINLYNAPPKRTFEPIFLNENIFEAYRFKKSQERYQGFYPFTRDGIMIVMRPFTDKYYCPNLQISKNFSYLHEVQDLFEMINSIHCMKVISFTDFVMRYGSRKLSVLINNDSKL
jgi:DNA replicative helicase MCM subunit Mcm2 (Cdc46/Mcm family)